MLETSSCVFCAQDNENIIFQNSLYRVILVDDKFYPGFIRLIINTHTKELTDISLDANLQITKGLYIIEQTLRDILHPDKVNLASFGNITPHLHWHVIPRFYNDRHFPNPIWGDVVNGSYLPSEDCIAKVKLLVNILKEQLSRILR